MNEKMVVITLDDALDLIAEAAIDGSSGQDDAIIYNQAKARDLSFEVQP